LISALPRIESLFLTLDAAPEVILRRKQELPPEELRRQLAAYRTLSTELPNSHLIRTDGGLEATTSAVTRAIVDHLGRRYRRRYARKQTGDALPVKTKRLQAWAAAVRAASELYSQRRSWLKKAFLAVLDQGLISGSNFLLAILLARWLSPEQYGAYALSFAIFVLFSFIQQGLFLEPMSVFGPSIYRNSQREYLGTLVWLHGRQLSESSPWVSLRLQHSFATIADYFKWLCWEWPSARHAFYFTGFPEEPSICSCDLGAPWAEQYFTVRCSRSVFGCFFAMACSPRSPLSSPWELRR